MKIILTTILILITATCSYSRKNYKLNCRSELLQKSLEIGIAEVGTYEKSNSNDGEVGKYGRSVGMAWPAPYCYAGQYWCFARACDALGFNYLEIPIPLSALANAAFDYAKQQGRPSKYKPEVHSLIIWRRKYSWQGHIERIVHCHSAGWVTTLAFNVSDSGTLRQGVFLKQRNIYHPLGRLSIRGLVSFGEML